MRQSPDASVTKQSLIGNTTVKTHLPGPAVIISRGNLHFDCSLTKLAFIFVDLILSFTKY